jgi:hypothetical protein
MKLLFIWFMLNVIHLWWMGVLYTTWHKMIPKLDFKIKTSGLIQKWWWYKNIMPSSTIMIYLWLFIWGGWTKWNIHIGAIIYCSYNSFCCVTMSEQLMMFKCKSNCINHKSLFCCASKLNTKKCFKKLESN